MPPEKYSYCYNGVVNDEKGETIGTMFITSLYGHCMYRGSGPNDVCVHDGVI